MLAVLHATRGGRKRLWSGNAQRPDTLPTFGAENYADPSLTSSSLDVDAGPRRRRTRATTPDESPRSVNAMESIFDRDLHSLSERLAWFLPVSPDRRPTVCPTVCPVPGSLIGSLAESPCVRGIVTTPMTAARSARGNPMIPPELQMPYGDEEDDETAAMRRRCAFWAADDHDDDEDEDEDAKGVGKGGKALGSRQPTCPPLKRRRNCGKVLTDKELQNLISVTEETLFRNVEDVVNGRGGLTSDPDAKI